MTIHVIPEYAREMDLFAREGMRAVPCGHILGWPVLPGRRAAFLGRSKCPFYRQEDLLELGFRIRELFAAPIDQCTTFAACVFQEAGVDRRNLLLREK
ncbi:hypothetical protein GGI1_10083, partial [Acidithiobacillus sp. GGI-221]